MINYFLLSIIREQKISCFYNLLCLIKTLYSVSQKMKQVTEDLVCIRYYNHPASFSFIINYTTVIQTNILNYLNQGIRNVQFRIWTKLLMANTAFICYTCCKDCIQGKVSLNTKKWGFKFPTFKIIKNLNRSGKFNSNPFCTISLCFVLYYNFCIIT